MPEENLEDALPGVSNHIVGVRALRKLRVTVEAALGNEVPIIGIRLILSFVEGEVPRVVVQNLHNDGGATHEGLHVCTAGDAVCTVEYVRRGVMLGTTAGAASYYANKDWHRSLDTRHRVVLTSAGRIRIALLVDVDATPDMARYNDYINGVECEKQIWTAEVVRELQDTLNIRAPDGGDGGQ